MKWISGKPVFENDQEAPGNCLYRKDATLAEKRHHQQAQEKCYIRCQYCGVFEAPILKNEVTGQEFMAPENVWYGRPASEFLNYHDESYK